jgi:outer membrane receptor protein involved in Fe transport
MKQFNRNPLARAVSATLTGTALAAVAVVPANAQQSGALEEIIVTAQKREQNLQDVPISVQVLGNQQLEQLNLNNFGDYVEFLPTVSWTSERPGISQVYMRGISSGGDGVHSGSLPSVGVYLDEQPVTTINHVLDVHIYDIARIETLAGPQGTYYGASSQAGTLRIITNKPELNETSGQLDFGVNAVEEGDVGYTAEGYGNFPIGDRAALRVVGWHVEQAGYIDNVLRTATFEGVGETLDNAGLVEEDFNDVTTTGARAALKIDLNDNWTLTPGLIVQEQESNGVFFHDPEEIGDLQTARFYDEFYEDSWYQASATLEGSIGGLDLVYAGAYLDRDEQNVDDYTHYAQYWDNYYAYYYDGCYHYDSAGLCTNPSQFILGDQTFNKQSHEIRLQSSPENRLRWIVGAFWQRQEHIFDLRWQVPDLDTASSVIPGEQSIWQTRQDRVDRDRALFGEISYDVTDALTLVGGYRYYEFDNSLFGFNGGLDRCLDANDNPQFPCYPNGANIDDVSKDNGDLFKFSVNYDLSDDAMVYATYSEGFRPGGVNRANVPGETQPKYEPDFVENYEVGWKSTWLDGRLRFNGAAYWLEWQNFQFSFLDFAISPLTIVRNIGQAETLGTEFDLVFAATEGLTLSLSASYNDAELKEPYFGGGTTVLAPEGQEMPFVPEVQYTAIGRYNVDAARWPFYLQAALSYTGDSWSNLETELREDQPAYTLLNLSAGIEQEEWSVDLFVDNATDERAQVIRWGNAYIDPFDAIFQDTAITVNRPRSWGLRYTRRFE